MKKILTLVLLPLCFSCFADPVIFGGDDWDKTKKFNHKNWAKIYKISNSMKYNIYMNEKKIPHDLKMKLISDINDIIYNLQIQ